MRIVAATNADVDELVDQGRFRRDLFYRLGVAQLRCRRCANARTRFPRSPRSSSTATRANVSAPALRLGDDFIAALLLYDWPGNIRQLANEMRRVVAMAHDGETIRSGALCAGDPRAVERDGPWPPPRRPPCSVRLDQTLPQAIEELERAFIERALANSGGRVAEAAQMLGLSRKGLFLKRRRRGMTPRQARAN